MLAIHFIVLTLNLFVPITSWRPISIREDEPVILHSESPTIEEFCNRLHKGIMAQFSHAWVWGRSAKHQPQRCGKEHVLADEDIVQICKKV
jgi:ribosome-interacting GTPase 1